MDSKTGTHGCRLSPGTTRGVDGILNINKPKGLTSFDVVAKVRRLARVQRAGHAGTLDPEATGVLLVCLGQATRMVEALSDCTKEYMAEVRLGSATDTYDATGKVTFQSDPSAIDESMLRQVLPSYVGRIQQVPPMYSALKFQGRPLYLLARRGVEVERPSREVLVHRIDLLSWNPPLLAIAVECGKGTYIRSLAHDIGKKLGCGAHLGSLQRTRSGGFFLDKAVDLDQFEASVAAGTWQDLLYPVDSAVAGLEAEVLDADMAQMARCGQLLHLARPATGGTGPWMQRRAYDPSGNFVGILKYDAGVEAWRPSKIFSMQEKIESPGC